MRYAYRREYWYYSLVRTHFYTTLMKKVNFELYYSYTRFLLQIDLNDKYLFNFFFVK